ncbi:MAG TPA: HYR domain-containing protein [Planctomycetota bacterium]|nr:HYR domain-containing protein [Planctomycetota bacterium]
MQRVSSITLRVATLVLSIAAVGAAQVGLTGVPDQAPQTGSTTSSLCSTYDQGFEVDTSGWNIFGPGFDIARVPSGTNGVTSATGAWHGEANSGNTPAGNWGGYGGNCGCSSTGCAAAPFPVGGYRTSIDIYLDVGGGWTNDSRFDFSSAISDPAGNHRRDFIFNAAFVNAADNHPTWVGNGTNRFVIAASFNSPGFPQGGVAPIAVTTTGWYTFTHRFYDVGGGVLACEFSVINSAGVIVGQWVRSNPTDIIGSTVGSNRYGWLVDNALPFLAMDNARRVEGSQTGSLILSTASACPDDADPSPGYQVAVPVNMTLDGFAMGYAAFVQYSMSTLAYRPDLSSYAAGAFTAHISPIVQADDGRIELDGNTGFTSPGTAADALLATLVFDVNAPCSTGVPVFFEVGGAFPSELSYQGEPLDTALVDPTAFTLDDTPPTLMGCPSNMTVDADAGSCSGAVVTYTSPTALDDCDATPTVLCSPPSGSTFPVGTTPVICTATDDCGNSSMCSFNVTVTATNLVNVTVDLAGVSTPVTRCIHFVMSSCASFTDMPLSFVDHDSNPGTPVRATATITVPCGTFTSICAKDRQHTKWNTVGVTQTGATWTASSVLTLTGGDTDDDGDIDINDVTWFLGQFGDLAVAGGCPFNGTSRDADFSNNGAIGSEDYAFLVDGWLTSSGCACALTWGGERPGPHLQGSLQVSNPAQAAADLSGDGRVDADDVELFEVRNGLSGELSAAMRASSR